MTTLVTIGAVVHEGQEEGRIEIEMHSGVSSPQFCPFLPGEEPPPATLSFRGPSEMLKDAPVPGLSLAKPPGPPPPRALG